MLDLEQNKIREFGINFNRSTRQATITKEEVLNNLNSQELIDIC